MKINVCMCKEHSQRVLDSSVLLFYVKELNNEITISEKAGTLRMGRR